MEKGAGFRGQDKYEKVDEQEFAGVAGASKRAGEIQSELKDASFDQRFKWISERKNQGNEFFRNGNFEKANEIYIEALSGLGFEG